MRRPRILMWRKTCGCRCGPHISFVEPFVMPQHYKEAVNLLTPVLREFEPFEVVLSE